MKYDLRWRLKAICVLTVIACVVAPTIKAFAQQPQQPPDPAFLQAALGAVQAQRNAEADGRAAAEARAAMLADQLAKANARIAELEKKPKEPGQ